MSRIDCPFETQAALLEALSGAIADDLREAIADRGRASLLVSGGSTPKPLFERLRRIDLPWEKVTVGLCDERWVPVDHPDSNARLVKETLLQEQAAKARFAGMYIDGLSAFEAEQPCDQHLQQTLYPFDVIILGMGSDGHTASLFPDNDRLDEAYDLDSKALCIAIEPTTAPHTRMSLTRAAILSAGHLYLHFEGDEKRAVYLSALKGDDMHALPIRSVLQQERTDIKVYYR